MVKAWQALAKLSSLGIYFIACTACNRKIGTLDHIFGVGYHQDQLSHATPGRPNADLHALFEAARHINYYVITLQVTKLRKTDVKQLSVGGGTSTCCPSYSHEILSPLLAIRRLRPLHQKTIANVNCYSSTSTADDSKLDAFYENLEEIIRKGKNFYDFIVGISMRKSMSEEREVIGRIPDPWRTSQTILLHKKGDIEDPRNYRSICLTMDEAQSVEQAGFCKGISRRLTSKPFRGRIIGLPRVSPTSRPYLVDYEKAFDSVETNAILPTLVDQRIYPCYVETMADFYKNFSTTAQLFYGPLNIPI
ncbi:unnamed protein product [Strongylus vulgaris]|uniref:Reverse transcriptase domain-containing protein n=1 Tax=Strongylus vulgaris TaxID=40348 RepID=A0A3P7LTG0_STRVU|nr:unnamed protein product [Strongylus vulgaris]